MIDLDKVAVKSHGFGLTLHTVHMYIFHDVHTLRHNQDHCIKAPNLSVLCIVCSTPLGFPVLEPAEEDLWQTTVWNTKELPIIFL